LIERGVVRVGAVAWAVIAAAVALMSVGAVNPDARLLVGVASVAFPLAAVCASIAVERQRDRTAGLLLLVSVATPTYFAWVLNVPALLVGLALLLAPNLTLRSSQPARQT
jgi:hypothetical protein